MTKLTRSNITFKMMTLVLPLFVFTDASFQHRYPKPETMSECEPSCVLTFDTKLITEFREMRSTGSLRLIRLIVSLVDQEGIQAEQPNTRFGWVRYTEEPYPSLPVNITSLSLGTMRHETLNVPLTYSSSTCAQHQHCRDAALFWVLLKNISEGTGVLLYGKNQPKALLRCCVLKHDDTILDCTLKYRVSPFLDSVIYITMALVLLAAVYICPWILVYVPHKGTNPSSREGQPLMELDRTNPVALFYGKTRRILSLPPLRSNRMSDRLKILFCFFLIIPFVSYIELGLLLSNNLHFEQGLFFALAWRSNPDKSYNMALVRETEEKGQYVMTWHGIVSICCYFMMSLGMCLFPRRSARKQISCPICALIKQQLKSETVFLSREIKHHMCLHVVVAQKLLVGIKKVFNYLIQVITEETKNSVLCFVKAIFCSMAIVPVCVILGMASFMAFILTVILLSPMFTVLLYFLRHSWHLTIGMIEPCQRKAKFILLSVLLPLVTVIVVFGTLGLFWILVFTFSFPSKIIMFTAMGLLLNAEEYGPYIAFGSVLAFNIYSSYIKSIEKYRILKTTLFEVCLEEVHAGEESDDLREIVSYNKKGVPQIPEDLYWWIADRLLPMPENVCKIILRIITIAVVTFVIFAIVMAFGGLTGLSAMAKSAAALLAGVLSILSDALAGGESEEELKKMRLTKKVERLLQLYKEGKLRRDKTHDETAYKNTLRFSIISSAHDDEGFATGEPTTASNQV